jgi:methyl-accepting chemotaxis protein
MNFPILKSFFFKLVLFMSGIVICATGAKLIYLYQIFTDADSTLNISFFSVYLGIVIIDGFLLVVLWLLIRKLYTGSLAQPLTKLSDVIQHIQLRQLYTISSYINDTRCVEIRNLSEATTHMLKRVKSMISQVNETSQKILNASKFIFTASKNQSSLLASQVKPTHEMAKAVRELVITVQHISEDVNAVVDVANKTLQFAEQGQNSFMNVVKSMEDIRRSSQVSSDKIIALGKQSEHINDVVKTIDRIIEDTKLIAFNATIEAARAKDEGKGFGVVALEIKRLAEEVFESTEDIKELIQEIQGASHALVLATEEEMKTVHRGALLAEEAGTSLGQIFDMVKLTTESAQRIASATQQQRGASEQVLQSVEAANRSTDQFSREAKQLAVTAAELNILADGLRQLIAKFEV